MSTGGAYHGAVGQSLGVLRWQRLAWDRGVEWGGQHDMWGVAGWGCGGTAGWWCGGGSRVEGCGGGAGFGGWLTLSM